MAAPRALRLVGSLLGFAALPLVLLNARLGLDERHLVDFRYQWHAGRDVLAGRSPYHPSPDPSVPVTSDCVLYAPDCFLYPPPAGFLVAPFAALPFPLAGILWTAFGIGALLLALRLVGLGDWRCYGLAVASGPFLMSIEGGTITMPLVLGTALAWRFRDRRFVAAAALGAVIALKLFLWPLALWFVATRRSWTAAAGVAVGAVLTLAAWAWIGFGGLAEYPALLSSATDVWGPRAYSTRAFALAVGLPPPVAGAVLLLVGGAAVAAIFALRGDDRRSFSAAVGAALLLTPIVWLHYFALLLLPLALARPRLAPLWGLPVAMLLLPVMADGEPAVIAIGLLFAAATLVAPELVLRRREDALGRPPAIAS